MGPHGCSPFPEQSSGAGTYGYKYAVVCTVTHRLVAALWLSRGASCQSIMLHL